jgi:hypothetical protein
MTIKLDASTLIASLPALLGYQVHDSIVAVMLKRVGALEAVDCVLRADLAYTAEQIATMAAQTGRTAYNTAGAVLIAVAGPQHNAHAGNALDALRNALMDSDIPVRGRFSVATTATPAIWMDVDTGQRGITAPWTDSPVTAEAVVAGKVIADNRSALVAEFDQAAHTVAATAVDSLLPLVDAGEALTQVIAGSGEITDSLVGLLATAIANKRLRDSHLVLGLDHADRAVGIWTEIARRMRGQARLEAVTIAAAFAYMAGDGVRAGIAVDIATKEAQQTGLEEPMLAALLDTALRHGVEPKKIREVILSAAGRPSSPPPGWESTAAGDDPEA